MGPGFSFCPSSPDSLENSGHFWISQALLLLSESQLSQDEKHLPNSQLTSFVASIIPDLGPETIHCLPSSLHLQTFILYILCCFALRVGLCYPSKPLLEVKL